MGKTVKHGRAHQYETDADATIGYGTIRTRGPFIVDFLVFTWRLCSTHEVYRTPKNSSCVTPCYAFFISYLFLRISYAYTHTRV